jgi:hypothetical protein
MSVQITIDSVYLLPSWSLAFDERSASLKVLLAQ